MGFARFVRNGKRNKYAQILFGVIILMLLGILLANSTRSIRGKVERVERQNLLKQTGLVFRLYAENNSEGRWPDRALDAWLPNLEQIEAYLDQVSDKQELLDYLHGKRGVQLCYLGHAVIDEADAATVLEAYQKNDAKDVLGKSIPALALQGYIDKLKAISRTPTFAVDSDILILRNGIERFLITDINGPAGSATVQSCVPVLWEIPEDNLAMGGHVLFMDGHVEFQRFGTKFPMSSIFTNILRTPLSDHSDETREDLLASDSYILHAAVLDGDIPTETWTPTIDIDGHAGYRLLAGIPLAIFPDSLRLPDNTKERLWPKEFSVVDMGIGHGFRWFTPTSVLRQEVFREHLGLKGGDDRLQVMIHAQSFDLIPRLGVRAVPYLSDVVGASSDREKVFKAIYALLAIKEDAAQEVLERKALPYLSELIERQSDGRIVYSAFRALGRVPGEASQQVLREIFRVDNPRAAWYVELIAKPGTDVWRNGVSKKVSHLAEEVLIASNNPEWAARLALSAALDRRYSKTGSANIDGLSVLKKLPREIVDAEARNLMKEDAYRTDRLQKILGML
jgi:prepilin-type processing-associated H-X9-DG protein